MLDSDHLAKENRIIKSQIELNRSADASQAVWRDFFLLTNKRSLRANALQFCGLLSILEAFSGEEQEKAAGQERRAGGGQRVGSASHMQKEQADGSPDSG